LSNDFSGATPKIQYRKEKTVEVEDTKIKFFCSVKCIITRMKRHGTYWELMFVKCISSSRLLTKM
jgi:hypothetical protein